MSRYRGLIVLLMDVALIFCCNFVIFLSDLFVENVQLFNLLMHIGLLTVCVLVFLLALRTYNTLWRYAESREYLSLLGGMSLGFALYAAVNLLMGMNPVWISGALTGTAEISTLCAADPHTCNTFENPHAVRPVRESRPFASGDTIRLPAASVVSVRIAK